MTVHELIERFAHTPPGRMVDGLVRINVVDRALALSSKAFVVLIPLTILTGAVVQGESFGDELVDRFGLTGAGAEAAHTLFESPDAVRAGISIFGIGFLVFGALSLARGLERVYLDAWQLEALPGSILRRLGWILSVVGFISLADPARELLKLLGLPLQGKIMSLALTTGLWLWTPYLLLGQRLAWRRLLPTALLTAGATGTLGIAALVYMPAMITENASRYGLIGVAFAMVSYLFAYFCAVIGATVIAAVLAGRSPMGEDDDLLEARAHAPV